MNAAASPAAAEREFAQALLDPVRACPAGLRTGNGSDPGRRFAVHRNNVVASLVDALADAYPMLSERLGRGDFAALARAFVVAEPPRSPLLWRYGEGFAGFIERFEPAARRPWLADLARLEWLRVLAFHAADAAPLADAQWSRLLSLPETLAATTLELHPSLALLVSRHAVVSLWRANAANAAPAIDPHRPESAVVLRDDDSVLVIDVAPPTAMFVRRLLDGRTLGDAAAMGSQAFDLAGSLALLIRQRAVTGHSTPGITR